MARLDDADPARATVAAAVARVRRALNVADIADVAAQGAAAGMAAMVIVQLVLVAGFDRSLPAVHVLWMLAPAVLWPVIVRIRRGGTSTAAAAEVLDDLLQTDDLVLTAATAERGDEAALAAIRVDAANRLARYGGPLRRPIQPTAAQKLLLPAMATLVLALVAGGYLARARQAYDPRHPAIVRLLIRLSDAAGAGGQTLAEEARRLDQLAADLEKGRVSVEVVREQLAELKEQVESLRPSGSDPQIPPELMKQLAEALGTDADRISKLLAVEPRQEAVETALSSEAVAREIQRAADRAADLAATGSGEKPETLDSDEAARLAAPRTPEAFAHIEATIQERTANIDRRQPLTADQKALIERYLKAVLPERSTRSAP